jgi:hypothetical protein
MKCRIAKKVFHKACTEGPFNYKKATIAKASRKTQKTWISVRDAWLVVALVFILLDNGDLNRYIGQTNMELAT